MLSSKHEPGKARELVVGPVPFPGIASPVNEQLACDSDKLGRDRPTRLVVAVETHGQNLKRGDRPVRMGKYSVKQSRERVGWDRFGRTAVHERTKALRGDTAIQSFDEALYVLRAEPPARV
jgi:hypothetical protein